MLDVALEMDTAAESNGEMDLSAVLGLSGHPGLCAEIYSLPIDRSGTFCIESMPSLVEGYYGVSEIRILNREANNFMPHPENALTGLTNESHGGVVLAERNDLLEMRKYFEERGYDDDPIAEELWNRFADGFSLSRVEALSIPGEGTPRNFCFIPCDDYLAAVPLLDGDQVCGYLIRCRCDAEGQSLPVPSRYKPEKANKSE